MRISENIAHVALDKACHALLNQDGGPENVQPAVAIFEWARIFLPYLKKITGNGNMAAVKKASRDVAHYLVLATDTAFPRSVVGRLTWSPSFSYICVPNKGKAAAHSESSAFISINQRIRRRSVVR